ncbi:aminoacyl-tRNA hydrolase [Candidatus Sumerlaeota bacterium]|nr:aminoacyl-tRNA hydrolase [Candidatus Sumerlaeota bacterium]
MRVIVGLGNPGRRYKNTPHNVGFEVIDKLAARWHCPLRKSAKPLRIIGNTIWCNQEIILLKPMTYMNLSGEALQPMIASGSLSAEDFLIICDDIHLPVGRLRLRKRGSDGGHKGLRSIISALGTQNFPRLRIGVGVVDGEIEDRVEYVLSPFIKEYRPIIKKIIDIAVECIEYTIAHTLEEAMSKYNGINLLLKKI